MTDPAQQPTPASTPTPSLSPTAVPFPADSTPMSEKEVSEGKALAVVSYALNFLRLPFWLVPLIVRNNDFALYHAKQCMTLWIFATAATVACVPLCFVCVGFPLLIAVTVAVIVLNIIGLVNAATGQAKPMPLVGGFSEKWFRGIKKLPS